MNSDDENRTDYVIQDISTKQSAAIKFQANSSWNEVEVVLHNENLVGTLLSERDVVVITKSTQLKDLFDIKTLESYLYVEKNAIELFSFKPNPDEDVTYHATLVLKMTGEVAEDLAGTSEFIIGNLFFLIPRHYIDVISCKEDAKNDIRKVIQLIHQSSEEPAYIDAGSASSRSDVLGEDSPASNDVSEVVPEFHNEIVLSLLHNIVWFNPSGSIITERFNVGPELINEMTENRSQRDLRLTGNVLSGGRAGALGQTTFQIMPRPRLSRETVAGIMDMRLGKIKKGAPIGKPTIRFDRGHGTNPHINIDPKGHPSPKNPHIEVPAAVVKYAPAIDKGIRYGGIALAVAAVAVDSWRLGCAIRDDIHSIKGDSDEKILRLVENISLLEKIFELETDPTKKTHIQSAIEYYEKVLRDEKLAAKNVPVKTIKTASSVGGGWLGGFAGGTAGAWAGTQTGAAIGALGGPVGMAIGAPIGAIVGAIGGGIMAGMGGSYVAEKAADKALDLADR